MSDVIYGTTTPMIKNGCVVWCEGDVFDFSVKMKLKSLGEELEDLTGYVFDATFYDAGGGKVHTFSGDGSDGDMFVMSITSEVTSLFPRGKYHFDIGVTAPDGKRSTIANDVPALVR